MSLFKGERQYYERSAETGPRPLLLRALESVEHTDTALDLGSGAGNDTRRLLHEGFLVTAVDSNPISAEYMRKITDPRLRFLNANIEDFNFTPNTYDIINAQSSLPFLEPEKLAAIMPKIITSLKPNGIFVGNFFGPNHNRKNYTSKRLSC